MKRLDSQWLTPAALAILLVLLVAAPGAADSSWGGTPLSAVSRYAICVIAAVWAFTQFFPPRQALRPAVLGVLAALVAAKVAIGLLAPTTGWEGRYTYRDTKDQPHSARFFWRFSAHDHRVDPVLALTSANFDLHFFNELETFGYPPYSDLPRELEFPLAVDWRAYLHLERATTVRVRAIANGHLAVTVDGRPQTLDTTVPLDAGRHEVTVVYSKPARFEPLVDVHLIDTATGRALPVTPDESPRPLGAPLAWLTAALVAAGALFALVAVVDGYARAGIEGGVSVGRVFGFAATATVLVWTASLAADAVGRTAFLRAGGDPLLYASDAREIMLGGPLVLRGQPLGKAMPFYFYPFYPYVLAVMHVLVGDDVSTIFLLNGLSVAVLPLLFWWLGWRRLGPLAAATGFIALMLFIDTYWWPVASFENPSLTDLVFTALVFIALNAMLRAFGSLSPAKLIAAGAVIGFCSATRPSVLTLIGLSPIGLWAATRAPIGRWVASSAWLMLGVFLALLPFTTRNLVASGQFVVLVNSWIQIPYFLVPPEVVEKPSGAPGLVEAVGMAWEIFSKDPTGTLWVEARKVLFTLGLTGFGPPSIPPSRILWVLPVLFAIAAWRRRIPPVLLAVLLTFTVSHLTAMVIAAPWTFNYKSIVPLHLACLCGAAFLLDRQPARGHQPPLA